MAEKILIIDDDLDTLKLVGLMLQKHGFQILAASAGSPGLDLALAEIPDLILLDIMMPGMDGYEVARRLRGNEKTLDIPIIMFTAKSQLEDKVAGFEAGADDYLTKPTHPSELQAHVKALLARSSKKKNLNPPSTKPLESPAYLIGAMAARGGLGVTTIVSNLAAALYSSKAGREVIMAEFRPGQGTLCYDLGLDKINGLTELLNTPASAITRALVEEKMMRVPDSFKILASSPHPKDASLLQNIPQFEAILSCLQYMARYVVVDLGNGLSSVNQKLVRSFQELILVIEPHENSIQHTLNLLQDLASLGVDLDRVTLTVNYRLRSDTPQLSVSQTQAYFKKSVEVSFTPAPELHVYAMRKHLVASLVEPKSVTAGQFNALAAKVDSRARNVA
jgi:CheY-like chemotaxis protein/MinD-like ATPase involved in chromosome partitioning or flagellar assembly